MSGPYVYNPPPPPSVEYRNSPYLAPFYNQLYSPFVPELNLDASPYAAASSLPGTPNPGFTPLPGPPPFIPVPYPSSSASLSPNPWPRERRSSWNGGAPPVMNPSLLAAPRYYHKRSRSDSGGFQNFTPDPAFTPAWPNSPYVSTSAEVQHLIHPYLDGEHPRSDIIFDLSAPTFSPMRYAGNNVTVPIMMEELNQPATYPPVYNMQIICDLIPQWPIHIAWRPSPGYAANAQPIKLGDIWSAIWYELQKRISQETWARLSPHDEHAIAKAYTKRCRAQPWNELQMLNQGVKQVDFLRGKVWFKGLLRVDHGFHVMKLLVA